MAFTQTNSVALTETTKSLSFPSEDSVKSKIPLWMKFYCFEYTNTAATRAMSNTSSGGFLANNFPAGVLKAEISVPAPINFETTTAHTYQNMKTSALTTLPPAVQSVGQRIGKLGVAGLTVDLVIDMIRRFREGANEVGAEYLGLGSDIPTDDNDAVYVPAGPSRIHEVKMFLPCLSATDSQAAGAIIRAFEALSLPTIQSTFSLSTTKFFHPPLWVFGIGDIGGKIDADWSGQPLLSALATVRSRKVSFDTNSLAAIDSSFKPIGYSVSLVFKEIEPAVRLTNGAGFGTSTTISNRSGAIVRGGINVL